MDPFVTRIGDVTIQRVGSQNNLSQEQKDEPPSETSSVNMEDSSVSAKVEDAPTSSEDVVKNETVKSLEAESSYQKSKTEKSCDEAEDGDTNKTADEQINVKSEDPEKTEDDSQEKFKVEKLPKEVGETGEEREGGEDCDGGMDASQFLAMAQAEAAEEAEKERENMFVKTGSDSDKEEQEDAEDDAGNSPEGKKQGSDMSPLHVKLEAPDDDNDGEAMDEDDINGGMDDSNFDADEGGDYEGMEGDGLGDRFDDDQYDNAGTQSVKSEPDDKDKKGDDEGDDEGDDPKEGGGSDIKKKLRTRQKRKVVVEDETDESEEERKKKRKKRKKKGDGSETSEETESEDDGSGKKKKKKKKKKPTKKTKKKDDDDDGSGGEKSEKKSTNMRRNIRDVMDETQLDEATLAAQRQEMERLRRVQDQQRILREMAHQRQQQQRAENKVMSLLQGKTSILKQVSVGPSQAGKSGTSSSSPNTVVVKVGAGATAQANKKVLELLRVPKDTSAEIKPSVTKTLIPKPQSLQGTTMMTPSVSIAPVRSAAASQKLSTVVKQPSLIQAQASYSASEGEEEEEEEEEILDEIDEEGEIEGECELEEGEIEVEGKSKKKKDVVTISSSSSSEDDCIVLSEPSDGGEDEEEEDPTNSGMHTNDSYNVPDEEGRVQVNMGKPEGDPDIFLAPHIARIIKPHQVGGIRFLYDNVIESIERFSTSTGFGCILAHSMGLGKTLQVITFCDIFLRHTPAKTVMCIMPINTLQNWLAEFNMWMPDDGLATPLAAQGEVRPRTFGLYVLNDSHKTLKARAKVVEDWSTTGGVLLIGYEMYRQLSLKKMSKPKKSRRKRVVSDDDDVDPEEEEKRQKEMLEKVYESLVKPGPDLVICDEGHRIKNSHASISMALKQIKSKRRVVLTGYPLQNNLLEYWCMVDFVRPNYLGTKTEFCNMFERPIQNGQCIDSTPQDIRLMRYRAHVLHSLLEGFVQRRSHSVLQTALPQKEEYVLLVRLTPFQRKLYDTFMNEVVRTKAVPNPLKAFAVCCKIWNHPDVLYQFLKKREGGEGVDLDLEEAAAALAANTVIDPTGTPVEEHKAAPKGRTRPGTGNRGRRKKDASPNKPAAAIPPNASGQSDPSNPYGLSGQYPMHGQMSSNSSMMGSYNPYSSTGQPPYGSFSAPPHHYNPSSSYGHAGYSGSSGGFSAGSSSVNTPGQGSFSGSGSSGYGDSVASSPASQSSQYGSSSSQSMFSGSTSNNPPSSSTSGYGSMGPPFYSGNSPSGQHSMADGFSSSSNYNQNWNSSSSYNSFNQGPSGSQPFSGSNYNSSGQNPPFQGYGAGSSSSSFNQSMYGSGSSGSGSNSTQQYQPGLMDQQMLDPTLMAPPTNRPNLNPNLIPQQSPVNASGMLPGGAPTKNPAMMPSSIMGTVMGGGMGSAAPMSGMGDGMIGHHSQGMGMSPNVYQNPNMMPMPSNQPNHTPAGPMAALSSMSSADVPPSVEDLLHSADEFRAFDPSIGKTDPGRTMYDVKDRSMFDPWGNSHGHSQDYNMINSQDMKPLQNSAVKKSENNKFNPGRSPLDQLKNEMGDVKLDDKPSGEVDDKEMCLDSDGALNSHTEQDAKGTDGADSWRVDSMEIVDKDKEIPDEMKEKEGKEDGEEGVLGAEGKPVVEATTIIKSGREDPGIPYDWAVELMKDYVPGLVENSAKMVLFLCILEEALALGDRILLFSQSLFTLSLIEDYLQRSFIPVPGVYERWQRNRTYFRLDGSTTALEREKLINEFNANPNVYLFLVSTRAGSLGINLVGANRVIVFDASWNPCHDTQAVCRVYRYGQKKPCYVYRFVMDNCLEKKIYDRQINKQGMSDRVVDECNPDAHLSIKEVTNLCWDDEQESEIKDLGNEKDKYRDTAMQRIVEKHGKLLTKAPFQHESLLVDRKDKKLSQAEKRLAKRSYEMEKKANIRPAFNYYNPTTQGGLQIRPLQRDAAGNVIKPIASVRPIQSELNTTLGAGNRNTKWIPAEVWQRQGMSAQEMTLPLDVVIPTNSPERSSIVLKAGQRVMVLKSPKGIYMQLENGKIIAIRTAFKMGANNKTENKPFSIDKDEIKKGVNVGVVNKGNIKLTSGIHPLRNNPNITITPRAAPGALRSGIRPILNRPPGVRMQTTANMRPWVRPGGVAGRAVPLRPNQNIRPGLRGLSPSVTVTPANAKTRTLGPVTITPRLAPATNFPGLKMGENNKDKLKADSKSELLERMEKLESDDGQSSNSSSDLLPTSSDSLPLKGEEINEKERAEDEQAMPDSSYSAGKAAALNLAKSFNEGNKSPDKPGSVGAHEHSLAKIGNSSSGSLKNFHLQDMHNLSGQERGDSSSAPSHSSTFSGSGLYNASEKGSSQSSSMAFPGNFSNSSSVSKQYNASIHSGSMMSPPNYSTPSDHNIEDTKSSGSVENQWKSPQAFSPGGPAPGNKSTSQQRNLESAAFDDNSNTSVHSNISSKSSTAHGSSLESRAQSAADAGHSSYVGTDLSMSHSKAAIKPLSSAVSSSSSKLNPASSTSSSVPTTSSSNFPPLDPYANLYGSYGGYPGGLPSSNYYSPYGYSPGFLPDPKSTLSSKSSTETNQSSAVPASRSSSKSSSSRSENKKSAHESSRSSLPAAYDSRQPSSSSSTSASTHGSRSSSSSTSSSAAASSSAAVPEPGAYPASSSAAAAAAAAYNPMMMSPSFNPASCQYPPPPAASSSTNPFTAAAAAAANYPNPYAASPYGYAPNQFESAMYSAFHRPDAGLDPTSPYLRPMTGAAPSAGGFYPQNVYGSQYGGARDPYAQIPPYATSPFIMPPTPYSGLASSASSTATSDQSPSQ